MTAGKNILMVLQSDYPPDIRLTKEIDVLTGAGFRIFLLCNNLGGRPRQEMVDGATVIRLRHYRFLPARLMNIPLFFNPIWLWAIRRAIRRFEISSLHVHDLPLAMAAIWMGALFHLKAVFDVHENYPAALRIWGRKGFFGFILRNPALAEKLERSCLRRADVILTVAEEHRELFISRGVAAEKIFCVSNTVDFESYLQIAIDPRIVDAYRDQYVLAYVGKFGPERDLETAIRALKEIRSVIPNVRLLLVGEGPNREDLLRCAREQRVEDLVEITGWVNFELTPSYITASAVCIVPQPSNPLIDNGVPHKLFQYMAYARPVISSDAKAISRVLRDSRCGEIFASGSSSEFAAAVVKIFRSSFPYGEYGREAVATKYNWKVSAQELLRAYQYLTNPSR